MRNANEASKKVLKKLQKFFTETAKVYVEDKNGEYGLVESNQLKELKDNIKMLKDELRGLKAEIGQENYDTLIKKIDNIDYDKMPMDQVGMLIETAKILISKNATMKISDYEAKQRGGDLAKVIQIEDGKEKTRGGIILPKDKSKAEEELAGEYTKTDDAYKILDDCVKKIGELAKVGNPINKKEAQEAISAIIKNNRKGISKTLEDSAQSLHELQSVKTVKKKNIRLGAYRAAIIGLSAGALAAVFANRGESTVAIQADEIENYNISNEIKSELEDTKSMIGNNYTYENGKLQEAQILGKIDADVETEVEARENRINYMDLVEEMQQDMDILDEQYTAITDPTNAEWVGYQIDSFKQYDRILVLHEDVADQGIEHIGKWNEYNQEHINEGNFSEETKLDHESEISYGIDQIDEYNSTKEEIKEQKVQNEDRTSFYEAFLEIKDIENVKDIESTIEKIYNFSKSDIGQELGQDNLFKILEGKNLDLFANFSDQNIKVDSLKDFMETYAKVEHSYNTYVRQYCDGNVKQADENKYIQFIEGLMNKGELDKVGEKNIFNKIGGILQIDKLNKEYYNDYGKDDVKEVEKGTMDKLQDFIRKTFDTAKIGDYNKMMKNIKEIRSLDNSKVTNDKGDLGYGEIDN